MQPQAIIMRHNGHLVPSAELHSTSVVALQHYDRTGKRWVVTSLKLADLGALSLADRQMFGDNPIMLDKRDFKRWMDSYNASATMGLKRYRCLNRVGIPFTSHTKVLDLLEKPDSHRSSVADMLLKFDLEKAEALVNIGKEAGPLDLDEVGGRWIRRRWWAFNDFSDAALIKVQYHTPQVAVLLIEL